MITLSLLHPVQSTPVQSWTFESESVVRVGRSNDNDVVVYSAVVSRHHLELSRSEAGWSVANLGANGTYIEKERITTVSAFDGMVVRLGSSGPKIQIWLGPADPSVPTQANSTKKSPNRPAEPSRSTFLTTPKTAVSEEPTQAEGVTEDS